MCSLIYTDSSSQQIYPQYGVLLFSSVFSYKLVSLRDSSLSDLNIEKLLNDSVVATFLGNDHPHKIVAQDAAQLRDKVCASGRLTATPDQFILFSYVHF